MINKKFVLLALVISFLFIPTTTRALTKGFEAISLRPATDGGPYIGIWGAKNPNQFQFEVGTMFVYAYRPFQLTLNGNRVRGILDNTFVQHYYGNVGLIDRWFSMGIDLPVGWWAQFRDPNVATVNNENKIVLGDIYVNFKSELVRSKYFGLAVLPFISIPDGYGAEFFGNGNVTGGGTLIGEVKPFDNWNISLNAGFQGRQTFEFRNITESNQLLLGLGTAVKVSEPVSLVAEIYTTTRASDPFKNKVETPVEARGAVKWNICKMGLLASLGGTGGIVRGSGAPTFSVFGGLSFSPSRRVHREKLVPENFDFHSYTVYFDSGSSKVTESKEAKKICDLSDKIRDKKVNIKVAGHTDSKGTKKANEQLSKKRAGKVAWFLDLLGIDPSRVTILGFGDSEPAGDNNTAAGRAENRRAEFNSKKE